MTTILYDDQDEQGRDADPDEGKPLCSDGGGWDGREGRQHQRLGDVIIIICIVIASIIIVMEEDGMIEHANGIKDLMI